MGEATPRIRRPERHGAGIPVEAADNLLPRRDFVAGLRSELEAAYDDAEQDGSPDGPRFEVGPVNVEFTLTAKMDASAKGGVRSE